MASDGHGEGHPAPRRPTLAGLIVRRLEGTVLELAIQPILVGLVLLFAVLLFGAWVVVLVVIAQLALALGLLPAGGTSGSAATAFLVGALILSLAILFLPVRWAARNILRAERRLDETVDRLATPATFDPGTLVGNRRGSAPLSPAELRALDERLAPSAGREGVPEEAER